MRPTVSADITLFVANWATILKPSKITWILNSHHQENETDQLLQQLLLRNERGAMKITSRENCYAFFSNQTDVARMESQTFICYKDHDAGTDSDDTDAGPINNSRPYDECLDEMTELLRGVMTDRTMYVIPFCLGSIGNKYSKYGIQITDSEYACINMKIMCRVGQSVLDAIHATGSLFVPCIHSVGRCDFKNMAWPCSDKKHICHFMDKQNPFIVSYGSGYGGNALLSKKCLALRVASAMGPREGWLAEHCLLLKMTAPSQEVKYVVAAFPSACGKTNLAMITPCKELMDDGWKFETLGDDIVWMHVIDGKLYAQNVENGFFGVAPGTSARTNPHAITALSKNCIFTNCATYTNDAGNTDVWWEGLTACPPTSFTNWKGEQNTLPAAHSNARYTCPIHNCPILAPEYEDLVPVHAIIFGGRRKNTIPLATKASTAKQGIYFGATLSSEETSANMDATIGNIRFDPMAMRPFIGYNVCDYFQHWSDVMDALTAAPVEFYLVNWFRKDATTDQFIWSGFSDNSKILKWIFDNSRETNVMNPFGFGEHPRKEDVYIDDAAEWEKLFLIKRDELLKFNVDVKSFFDRLDDGSRAAHKVPEFLRAELDKLNASANANAP